MKPNGKILSASTANGEEFIVNERQLSSRFSEYFSTYYKLCFWIATNMVVMLLFKSIKAIEI